VCNAQTLAKDQINPGFVEQVGALRQRLLNAKPKALLWRRAGRQAPAPPGARDSDGDEHDTGWKRYRGAVWIECRVVCSINSGSGLCKARAPL
jgi:hypothetical protein